MIDEGRNQRDRDLLADRLELERLGAYHYASEESIRAAIAVLERALDEMKKGKT